MLPAARSAARRQRPSWDSLPLSASRWRLLSLSRSSHPAAKDHDALPSRWRRLSLSRSSHPAAEGAAGLDEAARSHMQRRGSTDLSMQRFGSLEITPVTIQQMLVLNKSKQFAPHLHRELLIRLAKRHGDMQRLPSGLLETPTVQRVVAMYHDFFQELAALPPPDTPESERHFTAVLQDFYARDGSTLPSVARGLRAFSARRGRGSGGGGGRTTALDAQLDDFFTARLSVRMLIGQHCELAGRRSKIKRGLNVADTAREAAALTRELCLKSLGVCPEIVVVGHTDFKFTYVESHLHHMLFELLKNSVRAVVELHRGEAGEERRKRLRLSSDTHLGPDADGLPPVIVCVSGGSEDVVIKVSDEGGGIARSDIGRVWSYEYTTAARVDDAAAAAAAGAAAGAGDAALPASALQASSLEEPDLTFRQNFYGMGYGLAVARVFARYFGGDLRVVSTEGWGTDAYIYINRLESAAVETLPE